MSILRIDNVCLRHRVKRNPNNGQLVSRCGWWAPLNSSWHSYKIELCKPCLACAEAKSQVWDSWPEEVDELSPPSMEGMA